MSDQVTKLISIISGSEKLEACMNICEINTISDIMNINEQTIENMEKFIRRKMSMLPINERSKFIDDDLIETPDKFMIPPGVLQRILNSCKKITTIFENVPVNETNVEAVCKNLLRNMNESVNKVSMSFLQDIIDNNQRYQVNNSLTSSCSSYRQSSDFAMIPVQPRYRLSNFNALSQHYSDNLNKNGRNSLVVFSNPRRDSPIEVLQQSQMNPPEIDSAQIPVNVVDVGKEMEHGNVFGSKITSSSFKQIRDRSSVNLVKSLVREFLPNSYIGNTYQQIKMEPQYQINLDQSAPSAMMREVSMSFVKEEPNLTEGYLQIDDFPSKQKLTKSVKQKRISIRKPKCIGIHPIDYYYSKIVEDAEKLFNNCHIIPKVDFDIELNIQGKNDTKQCANFVCYNCQTVARKEKKLKFYLTDRGAIINSNIINHLKIHYSQRC